MLGIETAVWSWRAGHVRGATYAHLVTADGVSLCGWAWAGWAPAPAGRFRRCGRCCDIAAARGRREPVMVEAGA